MWADMGVWGPRSVATSQEAAGNKDKLLAKTIFMHLVVVEDNNTNISFTNQVVC